ncbi:MAG: hypothetical protein J6V54_10365 [Bacteroidales bacterium]|nr:hypothetical protein [Bacteroidales bacterium]
MLKKSAIRYIILLLLVVLAAVAVKYYEWLLPGFDDKNRQIYCHYTNYTHVEATFVKAFQVNDTLAVDATILRAKTPIGWDSLCHDFKISDLSQGGKQKINEGREVVVTRLMRACFPSFVTDTLAYCENIVYVSYLKQAVTIYHTETETQDVAIIDKTFEDLKINKQYIHEN